MTHRGPFQPLLFCDSVILGKKPVEVYVVNFGSSRPSFPPPSRKPGRGGKGREGCVQVSVHPQRGPKAAACGAWCVHSRVCCEAVES